MANITFTESSGLNDSIFGKSQAPIRSFILKRAEAFEEKSLIPFLFAQEKSTHWAEKYGSMTSMDGFHAVGENGAVPTDGFQEGYSQTISNKTWKNSFSISREIMEDSKVFDLRKKPQAFIDGYYRTREEISARIFAEAINNVSTSAGVTEFTQDAEKFSILGADGVRLFHKSHPSKVKGAVQSNWFADALSPAALAAAETAMQNFRDDNDKVLNVAPNTLLIPNEYSMKKAAFEIVGSEADPTSGNAGSNAFNYLFGRWRVIVWPYLNKYLTAGIKPWVLIASEVNEDNGGAIFQDRTGLDVNSFIDTNTHANVWTGYARFSLGFNDWRFAAVGGMAGGTQLVS